MILIELALQGVKGFDGVTRIPFKPGVNVAHKLEPEQRRTLFDAIYHCLFPDSGRATATEHLAVEGADARLALTFYGRDKITYRLLRQVKNGSMKLYRFDAEAKKYRLFTDVANEVAQYVRVQQQLPDEVTFERLFLYAADAMPSRAERVVTRSGVGIVREAPAPSGPGLPSNFGGPPARGHSFPANMPNALETTGGLATNALVQSEMAAAAAEDAAEQFPESIEERKALLHKLRADLDVVARANRAQSEIDAINLRKFELSEHTSALQKRGGAREAGVAEREADTALDNLPPNLAERLRSFEEREERFRSDEGKIQDELMRVAQEADEDLVLPLQQDRYFQISVVAALVFVLLAIILSRPFIAILNVPAAMVALGAALRYVADLERGARRQVRVKGIEERLDRLHRQRDLDTGVTRRLMDKLDIDSPSALLEEVERYEARNAEIDRLEAQAVEMRNDPNLASAASELDAIQGRLEVLEAEVVAGSGATEGEETLRHRVEALEKSLGPDVPPRLKSRPLGLSGSLEATNPDLASDLVASSAFSSHVSAANPLATGEFERPRGGSAVGRMASGVFPPPRASTGLGITGDLQPPSGVFEAPTRGGSIPGASVPPFAAPGERGVSQTGVPAFRGPAESGAARAVTPQTGLPAFGGPSSSGAGPALTPQGGLPAFPGPAAPSPGTPQGGLPAFPGPAGSGAGKAVTSSRPGLPAFDGPASSGSGSAVTPSQTGLPAFGGPASSGAGPAATPQGGLPAFPGPRGSGAGPAATPPAPTGGVAPSAPGMPAAASGPVVPKRSDPDSPFDFGGGFIGEDDEDEPGPPKGGSGQGGGASTAGYLAMAGGMSGFGGGGGIGGYGDGGSSLPPDRSRELVQATVDLLSVEVDALSERLAPRLAQYLEAFTGGRFGKVRFGARGEVELVPGDGDAVWLRDYAGEDTDAIDAALRFALAEHVLRKYRYPLLVEEPFTELGEKRRKLFVQMLDYFGRGTQVIVLSAGEDLPGHKVAWRPDAAG